MHPQSLEHRCLDTATPNMAHLMAEQCTYMTPLAN